MPILLLAYLALLALLNMRGLAEGLAYLRDLRGWEPGAGERVRADGPLGRCHALAAADNAGRAQIIRAALAELGLPCEPLPVPGEALPNLYVPPSQPGPLTLLVAHYDKSRETPAYQGASDNTAAVAALLAALELRRGGPRAAGVLLSAAEERGHLGARAFLAELRARGQPIAAVYNFDMLGRARLATRPSALPGVYLRVPPLGWLVYDGRRLRRGQAYPQPDARLIARLRRAAPDLVAYTRFTASSDSNVFQAAGVPAVSVSSSDMAYLDRVWERDSDRVELLDQRHLEQAVALMGELLAEPVN